MTQEHREMWLATLGWSRTERGHVRKHWWYDDPTETTSHWVTHMTHAPVKFRRFPFGRQPKHDALVGWFDLGDKLLNRGGLRELNQIAEAASDPSLPVRKYQRLLVDFWRIWWPRNKRQSWKTIEVGDGDKREKVVVEVMG